MSHKMSYKISQSLEGMRPGAEKAHIILKFNRPLSSTAKFQSNLKTLTTNFKTLRDLMIRNSMQYQITDRTSSALNLKKKEFYCRRQTANTGYIMWRSFLFEN